MCGFFGFVGKPHTLDTARAETALHAIDHRGPDASAFITDGSSYFWGHNRLSIIDLTECANQPFLSADGKHFIIFNGEIYNYRELKQSLKANFRSGSDTEVILEGFLEEGTSFFKRLRGMYAFVIGEVKEGGKLWVVRDPVGIKPLYLGSFVSGFALASEMKAILCYVKEKPAINEGAILSYINTGYISEPKTVYDGIEAVCPGHIYHYDAQSWTKEPFFTFNFDATNGSIKQEDIEQALDKAVQRNLISDIGSSVALSGGIDSSLVYYLAHKHKPGIKGLSVGMSDKKYDETEVSKAYSDYLGGDYQKLVIDAQVDLNLMNKLLDQFDQPFADSSLIPVYFLTRATRDYTRVLLAGDGGDEIFNGYPFMSYTSFLAGNSFSTLAIKVLKSFKRFVPSNSARLIDRLAGVAGKPVPYALYNINAWLPTNLTFNGESVFVQDKNLGYESELNNHCHNPAKTIHGQIIEYSFRKILLSDYLRKTDIMSMKNSMELRVPLLDEDLVTMAMKVPFEKKSSLRETKRPLRAIHNKFFGGIGTGLKKKGFRIPLDVYLSDTDKKQMAHTISKPSAFVSHYIKPRYIEFLCSQLLKYTDTKNISRDAVYQRVFLLYSLERWYQNYTTK